MDDDAAGLPADQVMWHRFVREAWCRVKFLRWPIALHFHRRIGTAGVWSNAARKCRRWSEIVARPDYAERIWRDLLPDLGDRLLRQSLEERRNCDRDMKSGRRNMNYDRTNMNCDAPLGATATRCCGVCVG